MIGNTPQDYTSEALTYGYKYDQLNRLTVMDAYKGLNNVTNVFTPVGITDYKEQFSYSPDGSIETLKRLKLAQKCSPAFCATAYLCRNCSCAINYYAGQQASEFAIYESPVQVRFSSFPALHSCARRRICAVINSH